MKKALFVCTTICSLAILFAPAAADEAGKKSASKAESISKSDDSGRFKLDVCPRGTCHQLKVILAVTGDPETFAVEPELIGFLVEESEYLSSWAARIREGAPFRLEFEPLPGGRDGCVMGVLKIKNDQLVPDDKLVEEIRDRLQAIINKTG